MNPSATGIVKRVVGSLPHFAEVTVVVDMHHVGRSAALRLESTQEASGFRSQGALEIAPPAGPYEAWRHGAVGGALFALEQSDRNAHVIVAKIAGLSTDTNEKIVALAAARAVWSALGIEPPPEAAKAIESDAFSSWNTR